MVAYTYRMPAGIPGDANRSQSLTIEPQYYDPANPCGSYGIPVVRTANGIRPVQASDTLAEIYGLLVRPYPTTGGNPSDPLGTSTPPTSGQCDVLKRGYMVVKLNGSTAAAADGVVYVRVATPGSGKPVGGIEAAADSTNTVALNAYFMGAADANGNVEIAYNL